MAHFSRAIHIGSGSPSPVRPTVWTRAVPGMLARPRASPRIAIRS